MAAIHLLAPLPLVLGDVDRDAVEVGADERFAAKAGQRAEEPEKDILGEIVERGIMGAAGAPPGEAQQGAEDHLLVIADDLLETWLNGQMGVAPQGELDRAARPKFHGNG